MSALRQLRADIESALYRIDQLTALDCNPRRLFLEPKSDADFVSLYLRSARFKIEVAPDIRECGWNMLFDLYANAHRRRVSVSSACIGSMYPPTTALRWLDFLHSRGLIVRKYDALDARRVFIELTAEGAGIIERWAELMMGTPPATMNPASM